MPRIALALSALAICTLPACGGDDTSAEGESTTTGGTGTDTVVQPPPPAPLVGGPGIYLTDVAIYQGVKRVLMTAGGIPASNVPVIAGRDALIRVFYAVDANYNGQPVTARLEIPGGDPIEVQASLFSTPTTEDNLNGTINFFVPGSRLVGPTLDYKIQLLQAVDPAYENGLAYTPQQAGVFWSMPMEGAQNTLRVVLVPFQYKYDGSDRLPDTSPAMVENYRQRFLKLYPVSNVEVTVREDINWYYYIGPFGEGWQEILEKISDLRFEDDAPAEVYYYAIFNPENSFNSFCSQGCTLGLTLLNDQPADEGLSYLRFGIGLGYESMAADTAAHELGHAHGLSHADCGYGLDPQSIDYDYPYFNGSIGTWGYDIVLQTLKNPAVYTDMMGYCDNEWISDYHYAKLFNRGKNVNAADIYMPPPGPAPGAGEFDVVMWNGKDARLQPRSVQSAALDAAVLSGGLSGALSGGSSGSGAGGGAVDAFVTDATGERKVRGHLVRYDHLPGGWLYLPRISKSLPAQQVRFELDGETVVAERSAH